MSKMAAENVCVGSWLQDTSVIIAS